MADREEKILHFDRDGKRSGWLTLSDDPLLRVPITVVRKGPGPALLLTGGTHGDEYEGPVALMKLNQALEPEDLTCGTLVVIPIMNPPALAAGTRTSPLDGLNLNRVFPGKADGSPSERIAHLVTSRILPQVDTVYDLHAGGRTTVFIPSVMIHQLEDPGQMARTFAAMQAFRAPAGIVIKEFESEGMLDTTVERMGKVFACCELGGAGMLTPETVAVTETGIRNLMIHLGLLSGSLSTPIWQGQAKTRFLEALSFERYVRAETGGLFEPLVEIADTLAEGQPFGQIHDPAAPGTAPRICRAPADGLLYRRRAFGLVEAGQVVGLVARETEPS
ncbi:MAG: succinylglutamate desuccinylase/aspartoacylase family protein [Pseudomonadota bacterium]